MNTLKSAITRPGSPMTQRHVHFGKSGKSVAKVVVGTYFQSAFLREVSVPYRCDVQQRLRGQMWRDRSPYPGVMRQMRVPLLPEAFHPRVFS